MSAGTVNALDNIDYALFVSNCPGLECVSRVGAVTDTRVCIYSSHMKTSLEVRIKS